MNMKRYIGTKIIHAAPATGPGGDGYNVTYADGYTSWSPKEAFDDAYRPCDAMSFGLAIDALKRGLKVARAGWNGKGMYLWLMPSATVPVEWCKEPHLKQLAENNGGSFEALGTIRMKTADNKVLTGWLASQTDMLAEDWGIVE